MPDRRPYHRRNRLSAIATDGSVCPSRPPTVPGTGRRVRFIRPVSRSTRPSKHPDRCSMPTPGTTTQPRSGTGVGARRRESRTLSARDEQSGGTFGARHAHYGTGSGDADPSIGARCQEPNPSLQGAQISQYGSVVFGPHFVFVQQAIPVSQRRLGSTTESWGRRKSRQPSVAWRSVGRAGLFACKCDRPVIGTASSQDSAWRRSAASRFDRRAHRRCA
jgi:hypothetical protein